ncbi:hypothetical protein CAPTEDRAFT_114078 [Capitella teleta]|uniref:Signal transducer and activator of transcription n=1 Tax=Capitella teleta TaxID=283909 RepID=R7V959_CAPTE|nr:hypothetical protein CAPTEDRAFT_114078 [Capitella teleta]|eukprot:ELU15383.1 hypothetical protein CAPTEDRAFT_114078 [Capitella teleta]
MALWAKVQQLTGDPMRTVQAAYGVHFPIEVRHFFAHWIEQQPWTDVDEDNLDHEQKAMTLRDLLLQQMEDKATELIAEEDFLTKLKLQETMQQFREIYGNHPMNLVRVIKHCLQTESRIVQRLEQSGEGQQMNPHQQLLEQFDFLNKRTLETEKYLRQSQHKQESWVMQSQELARATAQLNQLMNQPDGQMYTEAKQSLMQEKDRMDRELSDAAHMLRYDRMSLLQKYEETCNGLQALLNIILINHLTPWQQQQQWAGNGSPFDGNLDTLQHWCVFDSLADLVWRNFQQISQASSLYSHLPIELPPEQQDRLPLLIKRIGEILERLVTSSFVLEKQPSQVLKKKARFTATVRCLIGSRLNLQMTLPQVTASIVSEDQARRIFNGEPGSKILTSGVILNNTGTMEYHQASCQLSATLRTMMLDSIRRAEKKGNETVTEEKFSIFFQTELTINSQRTYSVWTLSLPVVVTVHGNQDCNAQATVLWDNAFAESNRILFQVPEKVTWQKLSQTLNTQFVVHCSLGLSPDNLIYLAYKLFGAADDYHMQVISWAQFNREPLPGRSFTFWEWFHSILKLTKDWTQGPWKDRLILGFISKQRAEDWLLKSQIGSFLLRFSDSELGGISISYVKEDRSQPGGRAVTHVSPFTDKDLRIRGLGDRVKDLDELVCLYPDIPKEKAFQKFWTASVDNGCYSNGYVKPDLTTTIPRRALHRSSSSHV